MTRTTSPLGPRATRCLVLFALLGVAAPASACDLDGLSHGYGPMSALFAGAHRYQALNGLQEEDELPLQEPVAPVPAAATNDPTAVPSQPRRSFVAWAKAKPTRPEAEDAPASWVRSQTPTSVDAPRGAPQRAQPEGGEQKQGGPSGGPVP